MRGRPPQPPFLEEAILLLLDMIWILHDPFLADDCLNRYSPTIKKCIPISVLFLYALRLYASLICIFSSKGPWCSFLIEYLLKERILMFSFDTILIQGNETDVLFW